MSNIDLKQQNRGALERPFSGVGVEFFPLQFFPDYSGITLHETGYLADNYWWNFSNVLSPFWRFYYNATPGHYVVFGNRRIDLTPEHIMLIPDNQVFHCRNEESAQTFWISFSTNQHLRPYVRLPMLLKPSATELNLMDMISLLIDDSAQTKERERVMHLSLALLHETLCRPEIQWQDRKVPERIQEVKQYMDARYATKTLNHELARMAGMSTGGFIRAFKSWFGLSPANYLINVRVREAGYLLINTEESIEQVAQKTGFPNRAYFTRAFSKVVGQPPAAFRRQSLAE